MPAVLAIICTIIVMIAFAWIFERLVLKHMVNQEPIILFMVTIGLAYFMEGLGDLMLGGGYQGIGFGHSLRRLILVGRCH